MNPQYIETLLDTREWVDKKGNYARAKKCIMKKKLRTYTKKDTSLESILYDEVIRLNKLLNKNITIVKEELNNIDTQESLESKVFCVEKKVNIPQEVKEISKLIENVKELINNEDRETIQIKTKNGYATILKPNPVVIDSNEDVKEDFNKYEISKLLEEDDETGESEEQYIKIEISNKDFNSVLMSDDGMEYEEFGRKYYSKKYGEIVIENKFKGMLNRTYKEIYHLVKKKWELLDREKIKRKK